MKKLVFLLLMLISSSAVFCQEPGIILCSESVSGSGQGYSIEVTYEYGAIGDCDHPVAGYGVATSTFNGTTYVEEVTNQEAYEQSEVIRGASWMCFLFGMFCM